MGLRNELTTCPEESYRLWYIVMCDLETSRLKEAMARVRLQRHKKRKIGPQLYDPRAKTFTHVISDGDLKSLQNVLQLSKVITILLLGYVTLM